PGARRDEQDRTHRCRGERDEVERALGTGDGLEPDAERHDEQEGEHDLDAGEQHANLLHELDELAVETLRRALFTGFVHHGTATVSSSEDRHAAWSDEQSDDDEDDAVQHRATNDDQDDGDQPEYELHALRYPRPQS